MKIAVVGLGKAGGSLVASARKAKVPLAGKANRLAELLHSDRWRNAELLVLAVPDDAIDELAQSLSMIKKKPPAMVVHMSGARGASALSSLSHRTIVGSFHPLASLDGKNPIPKGTLIAIDSDAPAGFVTLEKIAKKIGGVPARVPDAMRSTYHAGAVIAGNLPIALVDEGVKLLVKSGVPEDLARVSLARLLRSQAENAEKKALAQALTGPVARGDAETLKRHLEILDGSDLAKLYRALSERLIEVRKHDEKTTKALRDALNES